MLLRSSYGLVLALLGTALLPGGLSAQELAPPPERSAKKAFALSLVVPGLGHRYAHGGDWDGAASFFALADAGLWLSLVGTEWRRSQVTQSFEALAAMQANADIEGKDRTFFLNLATFTSSDEYLEVQLRNRAWDQIAYVRERSFQWEWKNEADFQRFRALREDAESLRRRRPVLGALLVANRLLAGLTAIRAARRADDLSLSLSPTRYRYPQLNLNVRF